MKSNVCMLIAAFFLNGFVQAASFACANAKTPIEKMVCTDPELSKLDEDLAGAYARATYAAGAASSIRRDQSKWIKERNACVDAECVKHACESRIKEITQPAQNPVGIEALYGKWEAGGKAGEAIYGSMEISKSKITWKGKNSSPRCTVSYELVPEIDTAKFKEKPDHFKYISPFRSYLLAIHGACASGITHFRMTLPDNIPDYIDMIEYSARINSASGYTHLHKH